MPYLLVAAQLQEVVLLWHPLNRLQLDVSEDVTHDFQNPQRSSLIPEQIKEYFLVSSVWEGNEAQVEFILSLDPEEESFVLICIAANWELGV